MRIPFWPMERDYFLEALRPDDSAALVSLHREDFVRPWSEDEFDRMIADPLVFGFAARELGRGHEPPVGFVLARRIGPEAEILTVAVARAARRDGIGWRLMDAVLRALHAERAEALFLEVDETNHPAIGLYRKLGFLQVGRRPSYYRTADGRRTAALVMRRELR